jgi:hypothetical protein
MVAEGQVPPDEPAADTLAEFGDVLPHDSPSRTRACSTSFRQRLVS